MRDTHQTSGHFTVSVVKVTKTSDHPGIVVDPCGFEGAYIEVEGGVRGRHRMPVSRGDFIIIRDGKPFGVLSESAFFQNYEPIPPKPAPVVQLDPLSEEILAKVEEDARKRASYGWNQGCIGWLQAYIPEEKARLFLQQREAGRREAPAVADLDEGAFGDLDAAGLHADTLGEILITCRLRREELSRSAASLRRLVKLVLRSILGDLYSQEHDVRVNAAFAAAFETEAGAASVDQTA